MKRAVRGGVAVAVVMLALDLTWLGVVAAGLYDRALGPLKAAEVNGLAAGLFYAMYVVAVTGHAVLPASGVGAAARRGAAMGAFAYATYELTNWAVIQGWPAWIVPIDVAWGVVLTGTAAAVGRKVAG